MIRVNLLATGPGAAPPREWFPKEQRSALLGLAMLLVDRPSGVGGWWWYLQHAARRDRSRASTQAETRARAAQGRREARRSGRARARASSPSGSALIDRLRDAKRAPVSLLETVSRSMPDGLWLIGDQADRRRSVQVDGRAMSLTSVTDFAETMQSSGLFKMPVEILTTTDRSGRGAATWCGSR